MKQVIFKIGDEEYGIDIFKVEAIEKSMPMIKVPSAPSHIAGIIDLRGEALPVYDLRTRFGYPSGNIDIMIITKMRGMKIAAAVDNVSEIVEADDSEVLKAPGLLQTEETAFVSKVTNVKGHMFISLDFDGIIKDEEMEAIETMLKKAKEQQ